MASVMLCSTLVGSTDNKHGVCSVFPAAREIFGIHRAFTPSVIETHLVTDKLSVLPRTRKLTPKSWHDAVHAIRDDEFQAVALYSGREMMCEFLSIRSGYVNPNVFALSFGVPFYLDSDWSIATGILSALVRYLSQEESGVSHGWVEPLEGEHPMRLASWKVFQAMQRHRMASEGLMEFYEIEQVPDRLFVLPAAVYLEGRVWTNAEIAISSIVDGGAARALEVEEGYIGMQVPSTTESPLGSARSLAGVGARRGPFLGSSGLAAYRERCEATLNSVHVEYRPPE